LRSGKAAVGALREIAGLWESRMSPYYSLRTRTREWGKKEGKIQDFPYERTASDKFKDHVVKSLWGDEKAMFTSYRSLLEVKYAENRKKGLGRKIAINKAGSEIKQLLDRRAPLGSLPKKSRAVFEDSLNERERGVVKDYDERMKRFWKTARKRRNEIRLE